MDVKIKILKKGDVVVSVFNYNDGVAIAVKRKSGIVDIVLLGRNSEQLPEITATWSICEGDNEVEIASGGVKISTF